MRVLFVSPVAPWPPDSGGRIRTFKLLRHLRGRAEVDLFFVRQPGLPGDALEELAPWCNSVRGFEREPAGAVRRWTRTRPERWFHSPALVAALAEELAGGEHDLVHLDELLLARSLPADTKVPVVLHHHKLDTVLHEMLPGASLLHKNFEGWKLGKLEAEAARLYRHHMLCSPEDAAILEARHPWLDCCVVPSGFDADYFAPRRAPPPREAGRLLFLGTMSYGPNVDGLLHFADEILPALVERCPGLVLDVVGRDPGPEVEALAGERVQVHGGVKDVRPWLERAAAMVAPLRIGGGTRLKLTEAFAMRCPVVATPAAAEGLAFEHGRHLRLAERPADFAREVLDLLSHPEEAAAMGGRARALALEHYTWDLLSERLLAEWRRICGEAGRRAVPA